MALQDIRDHIAKTPQMDRNNFKRPEYRRYPLQPTNKNGEPYPDPKRRGKFVSLKDAGEEDAFKQEHPDWEPFVDPTNLRDELETLREQNRKLAAQLASSSGTGGSSPNTGRDADDKGDGSTRPLSTAQVQSDASRGSGVGQAASLVKDDLPKKAAERPKPGSKLD